MIEKLHNLIESRETETTKEKKKKRFFDGLRNRFLALAAAGFITLNVGWGKDLLQKLEVGDRDIVAELVLRDEISDDILNDFKEGIERKEPEFAKLAKQYGEILGARLKNLEEEVAQYNIESPSHQEQDKQLILAEQKDYESDVYRPGSVRQDIDIDHKLISQLRATPDFLKNNHEFFNTNFEDIFWGFALLNDSKDSRDAMSKSIKPPVVIFKPHFPYLERRMAEMMPLFSGNQWQPEITLYPLTFMGPDQQINLNTHINILIHELGHAFLAGSEDGRKADRKIGNDFADVLDEGRIQGITYKIVRYLNRNNLNLKPMYNETDGYDSYLVIAEVMESIARTHQDGDFLVQWQLGTIDYKTMLKNFKTAFSDLGLSSNIYKSILDFRFGENKNKASEKFLNDLLTELKLINKVSLSENSIGGILKKGNAGY